VVELQRGDLVVCILPGDYGKPRPAVVVQSNFFLSKHTSIVVCPITSTIVDAPFFRITLQPDDAQGLKRLSQIMVDKLTAVKRDRIRQVIGHLYPKTEAQLNRAIALFLGLAD